MKIMVDCDKLMERKDLREVVKKEGSKEERERKDKKERKAGV